MQKFKKLAKQPAFRTKEMLSREPITDDQNIVVADAPYDTVAPGIYPDETVYTLEDGTLIALSVERHWPPNGSGIGFHGYARWIDEEGRTELAPNGAHVEASYSFHANPLHLEMFGADKIASDVALILLEEEPKLILESGEKGQNAPLINLSEEGKANASIRNQIKAVKATRIHKFEI